MQIINGSKGRKYLYFHYQENESLAEQLCSKYHSNGFRTVGALKEAIANDFPITSITPIFNRDFEDFPIAVFDITDSGLTKEILQGIIR